MSTKPRSLASELQVVRGAFPRTLFDGEGWERLLTRAATVPASMIENTFGFELRLGRPERAADFCVSLQAGTDPTSEFLSFPQAEIHGDGASPDEISRERLEIDAKRRLAHESLDKFLSEINREGTLAHDLVPTHNIILEYDVIDPVIEQHPAPAVFWGLPEDAGPDQMSDVIQVLDIVQGQSGERSLDVDRQDSSRYKEDARSDTLRHVAGAVVPYGRISQIGTFVGREGDFFRILVRMDDGSKASALLHDLGWSGNVAMIEKIQSKFESGDLGFGVSLDIAPNGVGPRVGIEVAVKGGWFATRIADWQPLIDILVANGWCREDKAIGLQQWCGYMRLFGPTMWLLLKGINHLKISIRGNEPLEVKAYIGARRVLAEDIGFG